MEHVREVLLSVYGAAVVGDDGSCAATTRNDNSHPCSSGPSGRAVGPYAHHSTGSTAAPATPGSNATIEQRQQL